MNLAPKELAHDFNFPGDENDRTNTMDFIDKMLNKGEQDNNKQFQKTNTDYNKRNQQLFEGNDFELPKYDGF